MLKTRGLVRGVSGVWGSLRTSFPSSCTSLITNKFINSVPRVLQQTSGFHGCQCDCEFKQSFNSRNKVMYSKCHRLPPLSQDQLSRISNRCLGNMPEKDDSKHLTLSQKFKKMFKDFWYVLIPVHVATSIVWFGGFYLLAKNGVDFVAILERLSIPDNYIDKLRNSDAGYYAISYACYKVATPFRYTVTIAGTTFTVTKLKDMGYIATTAEVAEKMKETKEDMREKYDDMKEKYEGRRDKMRDDWETAWEKFAKKKK